MRRTDSRRRRTGAQAVLAMMLAAAVVRAENAPQRVDVIGVTPVPGLDVPQGPGAGQRADRPRRATSSAAMRST